MKLEDQVCSLELAKRLKELGVKQESLFYWFTNQLVYRCDLSKWEKCKKYIFSAFTVGELGEMLPKRLEITIHDVSHINAIGIQIGQEYCFRDEFQPPTFEKRFELVTEADARAKLLIFLLKNKLLKLQPMGE